MWTLDGGVYEDAYISPPEPTIFYNNFSCAGDEYSLDECLATPLSSCDSGPLALRCFIEGTCNYLQLKVDKYL